MRGKWLLWMRRTHLFLGVFFTPLLLMFLITGWWQTTVSSDDQEADGGFAHELMKKFSSVHTSSTFPRPGVHHGEWMMRWLAVGMCIALIATIVIGLLLAWQTMRPKWLAVLALVLGIAVPAAVLFLP